MRSPVSEAKKSSVEAFKFSVAYPSPYMREPDLGGKDATLTIAGWRYADASDKGSDGNAMEGTVLSFKETEKELVLAKINHVWISRIHGPDPAKWVGKRVTFFPTTCAFMGDPRTPCIRVRHLDPETGKPPPLF